jgi:uncharacterized membrane protein
MEFKTTFITSNAKFILIAHLLALLGAHPIFHVCGLRVQWLNLA